MEITCVIGRRRIRSSVTAIRSRRRWNTAGASPRWSRNRQNRVTVGPVWSTARFTLATASVRSSFPPTTEAATDPEFRIGLGSLTELSPNLSFQIPPPPLLPLPLPISSNSKPHTGTTNGLRHGTQFGVPMREELVTVCAGMRGDAWQCESSEVVRAMSWRNFLNI